MTAFLIGVAGAAAVIAILAAGVYLGISHSRRATSHIRETRVPGPSQEQIARLRDEQEAWRVLNEYSVERAYGMLDDRDKLTMPKTAETSEGS